LIAQNENTLFLVCSSNYYAKKTTQIGKYPQKEEIEVCPNN
jgi:hypothetical protein